MEEYKNNNDDDDDDGGETMAEQGELVNRLLAHCEHNEHQDSINDNEENDGNISNIEADESRNTIVNEDYEIGAEYVTNEHIDNENSSEGKQPKLSDWIEDKVDNDNMTVTVAKARRSLWSKAKQEIMRTKKNISTLRSSHDNQNRSDIYYLYKYMFGPTSLLADTLMRNLEGMTASDYLCFMITFLMSCKNKMSVPMMHYCKMLNSSELMETDAYNLLWARIASLGGSMRQQPFWMTIEEVANTTFKALFLGDKSNNGDTYLIGLDDDKLHYNYSSKSPMNGLKGTYHACDCRKGFTLHTAALSASCVPICVMYQRELESVQATYVRILKSLFGRERGEAPPDLRGVTLASDRGYWKPALLFEHVLENGGNVEGTVQRVSFLL